MKSALKGYIQQISSKDETFSSKSASSYILYLIAGETDGISFSVLDSSRNKFIALASYTPRKVLSDSEDLINFFREVYNASDIMNAITFASVHIGVSGLRSTLVPATIYSHDDREKYFSFNFEKLENEKISSEHIKTLDAYNVFSIRKDLESELNSCFSNSKWHHHSSCLISKLLLENKNQPAPKMSVHVKPTHFELVFIDKGKLIFYNSFQYKTTEDFIYYIIFVCEQLALNPENIELQLVGEIEKNSSIYAVLFKYIRNIRFGQRSPDYSYSHIFNSIPKHYYYNLLTNISAY